MADNKKEQSAAKYTPGPWEKAIARNWRDEMEAKGRTVSTPQEAAKPDSAEPMGAREMAEQREKPHLVHEAYVSLLKRAETWDSMSSTKNLSGIRLTGCVYGRADVVAELKPEIRKIVEERGIKIRPIPSADSVFHYEGGKVYRTILAVQQETARLCAEIAEKKAKEYFDATGVQPNAAWASTGAQRTADAIREAFNGEKESQ